MTNDQFQNTNKLKMTNDKCKKIIRNLKLTINLTFEISDLTLPS